MDHRSWSSPGHSRQSRSSVRLQLIPLVFLYRVQWTSGCRIHWFISSSSTYTKIVMEFLDSCWKIYKIHLQSLSMDLRKDGASRITGKVLIMQTWWMFWPCRFMGSGKKNQWLISERSWPSEKYEVLQFSRIYYIRSIVHEFKASGSIISIVSKVPISQVSLNLSWALGNFLWVM